MNEPETLSALVDWAPNWVGPVAVVLVGLTGVVLVTSWLIDGWCATAPTTITDEVDER